MKSLVLVVAMRLLPTLPLLEGNKSRRNHPSYQSRIVVVDNTLFTHAIATTGRHLHFQLDGYKVGTQQSSLGISDECSWLAQNDAAQIWSGTSHVQFSIQGSQFGTSFVRTRRVCHVSMDYASQSSGGTRRIARCLV